MCRAMMDGDLETKKTRARDWFRALQEDICGRFEALDETALIYAFLLDTLAANRQRVGKSATVGR